jgi:DNA-binding NarL/FixJ family response regulator
MIADDHRLLPEAVRALLEPASDIEVAAVSYETGGILPLVAEVEPDLLLLDSHMRGMEVLSFLDRMRVEHPAVSVVLLTESLDPDLTTAAFAHGAKDVILKGSDPDALAPALRAAIHEPPALPRVAEALGLACPEGAPRFRRAHGRLNVAARLEELRALVDRAIFGNDYDWL